MKPIELNSNCVFGANQEGVFPLPAYKDDNGDVYTTWELTQEEREEVMKTGRIYLIVQTFNRGFNPLIITTENPFVEHEQKPTHVKIISIPVTNHPNYENVKCGTVHKILDPVKDKDLYEFADGGEEVDGMVWVLGINEPVALLRGEYEFVYSAAFAEICNFLVEIGFTESATKGTNYFVRGNTHFTLHHILKFATLEEFKDAFFIVETT